MAIILCLVIGCDNKKISQLEKQLEILQTSNNQKEIDIFNARQEIEKNKQQLEETIKELKLMTEKNEQASIRIRELESKINNLTDELGKDSLIIPIYLIGRPVVIYTIPYEDNQILIGTINKVYHGEKIIMSLAPNNKEIEIPFNNIIGYRLLK
jgi:ATP-dependent 26S proteasome regulatory subunit